MKFRLEIDTSNAAFDGSMTDAGREVQHLCRRAVERAFYSLPTQTEGRLLDSNGNTVGKWSYE